MDPVSLIVAALAAGAAAGFKENATAAVKDAYGAIKRLLSSRYKNVVLDDLERKPESEAKRASVAEDLSDGGAQEDSELLDLARQLVAAVRESDSGAAAAIGIDLKNVEAEFIHVGTIRATGTGFRGEGLKLRGGLSVSNVEAGESGGPANP